MANNTHTVLTRHHRRPRSQRGTNEPENISLVPENLHRSYHALFGNGLPDTVARILNETWIAPEYELIVRKRRR